MVGGIWWQNFSPHIFRHPLISVKPPEPSKQAGHCAPTGQRNEAFFPIENSRVSRLAICVNAYLGGGIALKPTKLLASSTKNASSRYLPGPKCCVAENSRDPKFRFVRVFRGWYPAWAFHESRRGRRWVDRRVVLLIKKAAQVLWSSKSGQSTRSPNGDRGPKRQG